MKNFINPDYNYTTANNYTNFQQNYPYAQISENDTLCLSSRKGSIKKITNVSVDISICSYKIIPTPMGRSLAVDAIKHITITYVDKHYNSLFCTTFKVPFCFYIPMNKICEKFKSICVSVENICVTLLNEKSFSISMVIFAYPVFQQKKESLCNHNCSYVNPCKSNIKSNKTPDSCSNLNCTKNPSKCKNRSSSKRSTSHGCSNCECNNESDILIILLLFLLINFIRMISYQYC